MRRLDWRHTPIVLVVGLVAADWDTGQCPDCFHEGYQVEMALLPPLIGPPAAVLLSGYRNGRCEDDLICTAASDVVWLGDLGDATSYNWWNSCDDEREMVAFAGGHAPTPLQPAQGDPTPFKPTLSAPTTLSIAAWVKGGDPTLGTDPSVQNRISSADFELGRTQGIFDTLGAGIKLDYTVNPLPWAIPGPVKGILDDADCDIAQTLMNGLSNGGAMAAMQDPARLNVYFVEEIHYFFDGLTCYGDKDPSATRYVIFVANVEHTPSTLAHEIGHALGLVMEATMPDGSTGRYPGDVNELELDPYLPVDNLMYSGVGNVRQITVGEVYRMHFDKRSWLWRGRTATSEYPRECQASPVAGGTCPPLTLHPTRGWP